MFSFPVLLRSQHLAQDGAQRTVTSCLQNGFATPPVHRGLPSASRRALGTNFLRRRRVACEKPCDPGCHPPFQEGVTQRKRNCGFLPPALCLQGVILGREAAELGKGCSVGPMWARAQRLSPSWQGHLLRGGASSPAARSETPFRSVRPAFNSDSLHYKE